MMNTTTRSATTLVLLAALAAFAGCDRRTGDAGGAGTGAGTGSPGNSTAMPPAAPAPDMAASPASR